MTCTPFAKIITYLNIADAQGVESGYQAEMNRAKALLDLIASLGEGQYCFVIMDEIFKSTNPQEGEAGAYAVAKNMATAENSICIIATHYKRLTELEQATNGVVKNYKVTVIKNPDGSFTYPYKLEEGFSTQQIALDLLSNAGFESSILQDAYSILNQKQSSKLRYNTSIKT
jgi:DNA mismatch repair protein MutS